MNVYSADKIRNIALLGHGGVGKTTITEQMAFITKATTRVGKVTDKNTVSDFDSEETKRGFSINTSMVPVEWNGYKLNVLDAPGFFDFAGEVSEALRGADAAIIVVSGKSGVQVGTELAYEKVKKAGLPCIFFVNSMDDPEANMDKVIDDLKEHFGSSVSPFQVAFKEGGKFAGFVNVPTMQGRRFAGDKVEDCAVPADLADEVETLHQELLENAASTDEELMEKFFMEEELTAEEVDGALKNGIMSGDIMPVLCGSAVSGMGVSVLMNSIITYFPTAPEKSAAKKDGADVEVALDQNGPFSAFVFKTSVDPFFGKISYIKVMSGSIKANDTIYNVNRETEARCGRVYVLRGKEQIEVPELKAGDLGALTKLSVTQTGDTLATKENKVAFPAVEFAPSQMYMAISPKNKGDEDKMNSGLNRIMEEDPTVKVVNDPEMKQELLYGTGDQHLDVVVNKLKNKFKVEVNLSKPKVSYRETIMGKYEIRSKYKKQSGGHGQYGDVNIIFEPSGDMSKAYVFEEQVFGGSVPKNYFPAVEKGIQESVVAGVLAGYPMVGLKATLTDGSYHPVDSSEMAFKTATSMAYKDGVPKAKPVILEPIVSVKVTVDSAYMGDIMGDMSKRRGTVIGTEILGSKQIIECEVPMSEMFSYTADLRSMTQGRGTYTLEFARYDRTIPEVQAKIIEEAKKEMEE